MVQVAQTETFRAWHNGLRDQRAVKRIADATVRLGRGLGDIKRLSAAVSEMKIDYGPGYRLYFTRRGKTLVILLCGGDKSSQRNDIQKAEALAAEIF